MSRNSAGLALALAGGLSAWTLPAAFAQTQLITNGGFDIGTQQTGWESTSPFNPPPCNENARSSPNCACFTDVNGHGVNNADGVLFQDFFVPSTAASISLVFYYNITTEETSTTQDFDYLYVTLKNTSGTTLRNLLTRTNLNAVGLGQWSQYSDSTTNSFLLNYLGQVVRLHFRGTTDSGLPTKYRIDDVSIIAIVPPTETVSNPGSVSGEPNPFVNVSYSYSVPGSVSSLGHPVEYSFDWDDSSSPAWSPSTTANHAWSTTGQKFIVVTARCQLHPSVTGTNFPGNYVIVQPSTPTDTTPPTVALTLPTNGQTFTSSPITVSGTASDPGSPSSGVNAVEVRVNSGSWQTASGTTSWNRSVSLSPGSNLIEARSRDGVGNYSQIASVTVTYSPSDTTPPTTPTGLTATPVSANEIDLSWQASTDTGGSGLAGYMIYRDGNGPIAYPSGTTYPDSGLSPSTQYCYRVSAYDGAGNESLQSNESCAMTASEVALQLEPSGDIASFGNQGGPFLPLLPPQSALLLRNLTTRTVFWKVDYSAVWLTVYPTSTRGFLKSVGMPGDSESVIVTLNNRANTLRAGVYETELSFADVADPINTVVVGVKLTVGAGGVPLPISQWVVLDFDNDAPFGILVLQDLCLPVGDHVLFHSK